MLARFHEPELRQTARLRRQPSGHEEAPVSQRVHCFFIYRVVRSMRSLTTPMCRKLAI
jgi:hypothetical protein